MRYVTAVATPADEHVWLEIALAATAQQLKRICREFRHAAVIDDPARHELQQAQRSLSTWWRSDGMLQIIASLPPVEGQLVRRAIEDALAPPERMGVGPGKYTAFEPQAARRADAFVKICERWLARAAEEQPLERAPRELVVHVDVETLLGAGEQGRCHLEDGPAVAAALARRVGCDSTLVTSLERAGVPLNVVSRGRVVSGRLRRALQLRDGTCRFPGCTVPARDCEGHHIRHHVDGGPTELGNLISLCEFHHHRHHEGEFTVRSGEDGSFEFVDAHGAVIGPPQPAVDLRPRWSPALAVRARAPVAKRALSGP
jgi:hypothetical protein